MGAIERTADCSLLEARLTQVRLARQHLPVDVELREARHARVIIVCGGPCSTRRAS